MEEPSLLDYLKERLNLRRLLRGEEPVINTEPKTGEIEETPSIQGTMGKPLPWRSLLAVLLALVGQRFFEPGASTPLVGIVCYLVAAGLLGLAIFIGEWRLSSAKPDETSAFSLAYRRTPLLIFVGLFIISFIAFGGNQFTVLNVLLWLATLIAALAAFWLPKPARERVIGWKERLVSFYRGGDFELRINWWQVLVILVFAVSAWFHLSDLASVPLEMTSDHTEKLLDVNEVLNGNTSIFFPRNSGREPIQFYLSAALVKWFGMEMNFTLLKLSMALVFLVSLVYVYQLGKELGNRWTGLFALLLTGMAAWTNILARSGMRLVLTPVFVAPVLFYLLRGFRCSQRNDLVLAGIFLGLGLMGYSAFRIMPFVVLFSFLIFLIAQRRAKKVEGTTGALGMVILFSLTAALPLVRYALQFPDAFSYRMATRMTGVEQAINGSVFAVFLDNMLKTFAMPFWRDGNTWITSVINRPALDLVSAAFYLLGIGLLLYGWFGQRRWQYLVILVSIPVLMLPSILALAFPNENPSLSRAGGAFIPIIMVVAVALESFLASLWQRVRNTGGRVIVILLASMLLLVSAVQNHDLVFRQYNQQYQSAAWNSSQMGEIARDYINSIGHPDTVWVVAVPYWVDTRLVAFNAGYIGRDYQIWPQDLQYTLNETRVKLFFVKATDTEGMQALISLYPNGFSQYHAAQIPGREFYTYVVPSAETGQFVP
jgi:hypothetical protein